ncbi:hypothetical protein [Streptosporangium jomthongense]|uniref:Uncharacterized protein n=1 Tax=Streptosporangium jomthongense TaxID=1193683 RepID=A0ABV8FH04_9ACTN
MVGHPVRTVAARPAKGRGPGVLGRTTLCRLAEALAWHDEILHRSRY